MKRLVKQQIVFRSLYSDDGKKYLEKYGFPPDYDRSLVYIYRDKAYTESEAVLRVTKQLRRPWPLLSGFLILPRRMRDPVYRLAARHRHHIPL